MTCAAYELNNTNGYFMWKIIVTKSFWSLSFFHLPQFITYFGTFMRGFQAQREGTKHFPKKRLKFESVLKLFYLNSC